MDNKYQTFTRTSTNLKYSCNEKLRKKSPSKPEMKRKFVPCKIEERLSTINSYCTLPHLGTKIPSSNNLLGFSTIIQKEKKSLKSKLNIFYEMKDKL